MSQLSIAPYVGGKYHLAREYAAIMPYKGIKTFYEGYGGMGNVLLNKPKHEIEYYNDIFTPVYNIFKCLSDPKISNLLINRMLETEYSKREFMVAKHYFMRIEDPVESAAMTLVLLKQSVNASLEKIKWRGFHKGGEAEDYINSFYGLYDAAERLSTVNVIQRDIKEILTENKDDDSICWFLDPPYNPAERSGKLYVVDEDTIQKQMAFLAAVREVKGKVIICGYKEKSTLYDDVLLPSLGWKSFIIGEVSKSMQMKGIGESKDRAYEWVWVNYNI